MASEFKVKAEEAQKLLDKIDTFKASKYPAMSYEQGIEEVLMWLLEGQEKPEL